MFSNIFGTNFGEYPKLRKRPKTIVISIFEVRGGGYGGGDIVIHQESVYIVDIAIRLNTPTNRLQRWRVTRPAKSHCKCEITGPDSWCTKLFSMFICWFLVFDHIGPAFLHYVGHWLQLLTNNTQCGLLSLRIRLNWFHQTRITKGFIQIDNLGFIQIDWFEVSAVISWAAATCDMARGTGRPAEDLPVHPCTSKFDADSPGPFDDGCSVVVLLGIDVSWQMVSSPRWRKDGEFTQGWNLWSFTFWEQVLDAVPTFSNPCKGALLFFNCEHFQEGQLQEGWWGMWFQLPSIQRCEDHQGVDTMNIQPKIKNYT